ncbi:serine/threonine protein kinase [Maribrevibacterium harenarium]|nr:protein kinase [Maribrevibacterium harenarium]
MYPVQQVIYQSPATQRAFYRVKHAQLGIQYGLKEITLADGKGMKEILNEIIALNRLPFSLAAKCHQHWSEGNKHFLLLDWIEGKPLSQLEFSADTDRHELAKQLKIAEMIGRKIMQLHRYRVIHRDIKPENVVVHTDKSGNPIDVNLIDFGLANQPRQLEEGTANYRAPEQEYSRGENLSYACDIFSFSQLIHYLLAGTPVMLEPNFSGSDWHAVSLALPRELPPRLEIVLRQGLQFNYKKVSVRPTTP